MNRDQHRNAAVLNEPAHSRRQFDAGSRDLGDCPLCFGPSKSIFFKKGYPIRDCLECGHRFAGIVADENHIGRIYGDHYFKGSEGEYPDYLADKDTLVAHGKRYARLLGQHMEPGTVLDVGAAGGFILRGLENMEWKGYGLEPNPTMAAHAQRQLGVSVEPGTLEENRIGGQYDLITMLQVVAHFVDPHRAFEAASKLTKPGGYWLIESWDRASWTAKILGRAWHEYNPPSVLHWFSIESLGEFVESFGMREIAYGRPVKRISVSHARSAIQSELGGSGRFGKLIDSGLSIIPERSSLPYFSDDIFWALYRKPQQGGWRVSD